MQDPQPVALDAAVAVVDEDPKFRTRLAMQLANVVQAGAYQSLDALAADFALNRPTVLVVGPSFVTEAGFEALASLSRNHRVVETVLVVEELTTALLQQAIRSGIGDVVTFSLDAGPLIEAVERASSKLPESVTQLIAPVPETPKELGKAITVFSTKGGAGKSVVAINLAVALAKKSDRPVVVLDADLQFGDIAVMLKLAPEHTIVDAVSAIDRLDTQLLKSLLIKHESSGVFVLPAPTEPAFADQVSVAAMTKIVDLLKEFCGYIVIDSPAHFNEVVLGLLEASDNILLVAGMDIPNIKNVKIGLQVLRLLEVPASKLKLVLNRANSKVKLDISEVEKTLQLKADSLIPSDMLIPQSVNKGVPAMLEAPKSPVAKSFEQLAELFLVTQAAEVAK